MNKNDTFQRQISATIIQLRLRSPFFATLALFARILPSEISPTACTDGRDIFINPQFWQDLTIAERLGLLTHEVLHAALLHIPRRGTRHPLIWNIAADIVVNGVVLAEGFTLPKGHVRNQKLEHLSAEEIYHKIQGEDTIETLLQSIFADLLDSETGSTSPATDTELERYWKQALKDTETLVKVMGHGTQPAGLRREITQLKPSQLDWRSYLWRFLVQTPTDFEGFDRRFISQSLYLDTLAGEKLYVFIAVDTSGSIRKTEIELFLGEVQGILGAYPHLEAILYYADAAIYGPYELIAASPIPEPKGGGGTDFRPFFLTIESSLDSFSSGVCVYLTDGYGTFPPEPPSLPTLWVLSPGGIAIDTVPFGEAVRLLRET